MLKINIIRGEKDPEPIVKQITFQEARKSLNGDFMIFDHDLIDIVVSKENSRVSTFPKDIPTEETYSVQEGLLQSLSKSGVLDRGSIKSGAVHSSLEGQILESADEEISAIQVTLLEIFNFLESEQPNMQSREMYKDNLQDYFLDPEEEDSTELGEVPHREKKGSLDHQVRPYGYQYMYSILREMLER